MTGQELDFDYLVIGSGFGGSVSAMRLSQKGYKVGVIESGKRWANEDFAKTNWNLRKYLWMPRLFLYGIQRMNLLDDIFILSGAGVGGGSLNLCRIPCMCRRIPFLSMKLSGGWGGNPNSCLIMSWRRKCWEQRKIGTSERRTT